MKKIILLILTLSILMVSCSYKEQNKSKDPVVKKEVSQTEQLKAIGNINFFITEKAFNNEKESFLKTVHNPESDIEYSAALPYKLGNYTFVRLDGGFDNDKLMSVSLIGLIYRDNYNPDVANKYKALYDLLFKKYGKPNEVQSIPTELELLSGKESICALWELGNKSIMIKIYSTNSLYYVDLDIYRMDVVNQIKKRIDKSDEQNTNNSVYKI